VFREVASGAKTDRAQLRRLLDQLETDDVLMVTRLDRLARSTRDLLNTLAAITAKKAGFRSLGDTWADTTKSHGRLMLTVLGGLAEFERDLIRARTGEGRDRAKARGVKMGRKPKLTPHQKAEAIIVMVDGGDGKTRFGGRGLIFPPKPLLLLLFPSHHAASALAFSVSASHAAAASFHFPALHSPSRWPRLLEPGAGRGDPAGAAIRRARRERRLSSAGGELVVGDYSAKPDAGTLRQGHSEAAEELYRKALSIAEEQEAKLWEFYGWCKDAAGRIGVSPATGMCRNPARMSAPWPPDHPRAWARNGS